MLQVVERRHKSVRVHRRRLQQVRSDLPHFLVGAGDVELEQHMNSPVRQVPVLPRLLQVGARGHQEQFVQLFGQLRVLQADGVGAVHFRRHFAAEKELIEKVVPRGVLQLQKDRKGRGRVDHQVRLVEGALQELEHRLLLGGDVALHLGPFRLGEAPVGDVHTRVCLFPSL